MSKLPKKTREKSQNKNAEHQRYISRITKTLYYGKFPRPDGLSLPFTELAADLFSEAQRGRTLDRLHCDDAANISRNACVSPCSLIIAILYLERLKKTCPEYVERTASSDLFLVSLMVSCKFLYDDGEADEVFVDEWASSAGMSVKRLVQLERDFLKAIEWEIFVNELAFWKKLSEVETSLAKKQGVSRGFYTYTELHTLLSTIELQNIIQAIVSMSMILVASYTAALITLFGSVLIVSHIPGACLQPKKDLEVPNNTVVRMGYQTLKDNNVFRLNPDPNANTSNILKTGAFWASIESLGTYGNNNSGDLDDEGGSVQSVSWDWWSIPALNWLYESSKVMEKIEVPPLVFLSWQYFYETCVMTKYLELEDQIHKPSKTRIQDQIESSWHEEWTDTIRHGAYGKYLHHYLQNVKS